MDLKDIEWKEFVVGELFDEINNSKAYHKNQITETTDNENSIPYISRTRFNNGLELLVEDDGNFTKNPGNTIVFGAENANFFYEPFEYITGNKMYYIKDSHFNKYVCLFLVALLNKNIGEHFGYSHGLTATRLKRQKIILPVNSEGEPDYKFMENYIKKVQDAKIKKTEYIANRINSLNYVDVDPLNCKKWEQFYIDELFNINPGKRLTKANMIPGDTPFIGASSSNNGITNYVGNSNDSYDCNVLGVNYNGSVVENFYHPYCCLFSDDVKRFHLKNYEDNKHVLLFFKAIILKQKEKYMYGYKFNEERMRQQLILVPVNNENKPDYKYMEQYMINKELELLTSYMNYLNALI